MYIIVYPKPRLCAMLKKSIALVPGSENYQLLASTFDWRWHIAFLQEVHCGHHDLEEFSHGLMHLLFLIIAKSFRMLDDT